MMRKYLRKILVSIVVMLVCVAAIQWARFLTTPKRENPYRITSNRVKGNPKANIQIVEYVDFRCGPCAMGAVWLKEFMAKYPDQIYFEVRYFPLHLSDGALGARFAECALKQNKFWPVHDTLMVRQGDWIRLVNPESFYLQVAQENQMDIAQLETCWKDPDVYDFIMQIKQEGKDLGVSATPTYFVNGTMLVGASKLKDELYRLLGIKENPEQPKVKEAVDRPGMRKELDRPGNRTGVHEN